MTMMIMKKTSRRRTRNKDYKKKKRRKMTMTMTMTIGMWMTMITMIRILLPSIDLNNGALQVKTIRVILWLNSVMWEDNPEK